MAASRLSVDAANVHPYDRRGYIQMTRLRAELRTADRVQFVARDAELFYNYLLITDRLPMVRFCGPNTTRVAAKKRYCRVVYVELEHRRT